MNYVGEHPLNLLSTLAVVSSASTSTGAAICRALLNSNALVLGVDSDEPHPSTQSSRASHFQFLKYAPEDSEKVCFKGSVVRDAEKKFGREGIDVLVVVKEEGSDMGLNGMRDVVDFMKGQEEGGLVITVYAGKDQKEEAKIVQETKAAYKKSKEKGVVCNTVVHRDVTENQGHNNTLELDPSVKRQLQDHVEAHDSQRAKGGFNVEKEREIANAVLFLCTKPGREIRGVLVGSKGSCAAL